MARTLDPVANAVRRDAFIDVGERLVRTKGYERMSIQDILDELGASRGAFYHYFDSKAALLEAVVERMVDTALAAMRPVIDDPERSAVQKLSDFFGGIAQWKSERRDLMLGLMDVWLADENAIVREKFRKDALPRIVPLLRELIEQGNTEGSFHVADPEGAARIVVTLLQGMNEMAVEVFVANARGEATRADAHRILDPYVPAIDRILGAHGAPLRLFDPQVLDEWFV
jgi:AcrR family transcriptional regulator